MSGEEEDSSESELDDLEGKEMEELRRYFLKKDKTSKGEGEETKRKQRERERLEKHEKRKKAAVEEDDEEWQQVERGAKIQVKFAFFFVFFEN